MTTTPSIRIGKISSKKAVYPSESSYIASMKATTKELQDILLQLLKDVEGVTPQIMLVALQPTFDKSLMYCPIDKGPLRASGYLEVTQFRGQPRVEMGYARGGTPEYAVFVHENMQFSHKAPTRAKWLQAAMFEDLPLMADRLRVAYKASMGV